MKIFFNIASYTMLQYLKKKSFIITTVMMCILSILLGSVPAIINVFSSNKKTKTVVESKEETKKNYGSIYISDSESILGGDFSLIEESFPNTKLEIIDKSQVSSTLESIKDDAVKSLIVLTKNKENIPSATFYYKASQPEVYSSKVENTIRKAFMRNALSEYKVSSSDMKKIDDGIDFRSDKMEGFDISGYLVSAFINLLLFFAIYFYGYGIAMSVASEKTSRVMELLITSASPNKIILGKCFGMGVLGLLQIIVITGLGILSFMITSFDSFKALSPILSNIHITPMNMIVLIVYFVLGYSLYCMLNAVAGACVSKAEDVNSALTPINLVIIASFYASFFTLQHPKSIISKLAAYIPFSSPFAMSGRIFITDVTSGEMILSMVILIVSVIVIIKVSLNLYSKAVLHYGERLKLKDIFKISK